METITAADSLDSIRLGIVKLTDILYQHKRGAETGTDFADRLRSMDATLWELIDDESDSEQADFDAAIAAAEEE